MRFSGLPLRRPAARRALAALLVIALFLWLFRPEPIRHLQLVSVEPVPPRSVPHRTPGLGTEDVIHTAGAVYRVRFSGERSWIGRIARRNMNVYMIAQPCDRADVELFASGPFVGRTPVEPYQPPDALARIIGHGSALYDAYVPVIGSLRRVGRYGSNAVAGKYDLHARDVVLCMQIAGGSMIGAYAASNVVEVRLPVLSRLR